MAVFKYKAMTAEGAKVDGSRTAANKEEVIERLRQVGQYPISIEEVVEENRKLSLMDHFSKVKPKDVAVFCRQFFTMLNAGVIILNCLDILRVQTENKKLQMVIGEIYEDVQKGMTLSEAMSQHPNVFSELLINMVAAGEVSGTLDIIMDRMATHFEKENKIAAKVKSAMIYPSLLGSVAILVVVFLLVKVMPTFIDMFASSGVELPAPTRALLFLSDLITKHGLVILVAFGVLAYIARRIFRTERGAYATDKIKLKLPVVGSTMQKIYTSRFTRTLSTLIASGIPLIRALEVITKVVGNKVVEEAMTAAIEDVKKGVSLSVPIRNMKLFPPMVHYMITIGEESGSLDDIMDRTANYYDDEVDTAMTRLVALMEPIMILVMAVLVGGIAVAIVMPMFDMLQTVQ